jgi:6-pyruvoyltetrahydropterin/6-carboxytetrahydropterin synthase
MMSPEAVHRVVEIDLAKERLKFSAGHFTLFSATERENLHGHNFAVAVRFKAEMRANGMVCDYAVLKESIAKVCDSLDEHFLLPEKSQYLEIERRDGLVLVRFADESLQFLARDVKLLAVSNITVEELSGWILDELRRTLPGDIARLILEIRVRVSSSPGQGATTTWTAARSSQ